MNRGSKPSQKHKQPPDPRGSDRWAVWQEKVVQTHSTVTWLSQQWLPWCEERKKYQKHCALGQAHRKRKLGNIPQKEHKEEGLLTRTRATHGGPPLSGDDIWLMPSLGLLCWEWQMPVLTTVSETGSRDKAKVPFTKFKLIRGAVSKWQHSLLGYLPRVGETKVKTEFSNNQKHRVCWLHPIIKCKILLSCTLTLVAPAASLARCPWTGSRCSLLNLGKLSSCIPGAKNRAFSDTIQHGYAKIKKEKKKVCFFSSSMT